MNCSYFICKYKMYIGYCIWISKENICYISIIKNLYKFLSIFQIIFRIKKWKRKKIVVTAQLQTSVYVSLCPHHNHPFVVLYCTQAILQCTNRYSAIMNDYCTVLMLKQTRNQIFCMWPIHTVPGTGILILWYWGGTSIVPPLPPSRADFLGNFFSFVPVPAQPGTI